MKDCSNSGIYSVVVQKMEDWGHTTVSVVQDGRTLDSKSTSADYGVVSLAGNC
jgi:hypothetical protein